MELVECKSCGSKDLTEENGTVVCNFCQSRYIPQTPQFVATSVPILETPKTQFDVVLQSVGSSKNKIAVIKQVLKLTGLGLAEGKKLVESAPGAIITGVSIQDAESAKAQLERAGGVVSIV